MRKLLSFLLVLSILVSAGGTAFAASWTCPDCGTENSGNFCGNCGSDGSKRPSARRESIIDLSRSEEWFCLNCDSSENTAFCTNCGEKRSEGMTGSIVTFGAYEQDNNTENGAEPIEWIVLDQNENGILVVSRYMLDRRAYDEEAVDTTSDTFNTGSWLNGPFLDTAFTTEELAMIRTVARTANKNQVTVKEAAGDTESRVFLLSAEELHKYFRSDETSKIAAMADKIANEADTESRQSVGDAATGWWWSRVTGGDSGNAADTGTGGSVRNFGSYISRVSYVVRPAMWIRL